MGYDAVSGVMNACVRFDLFDEIEEHDPVSVYNDLDQAWMAWRCRETRRRTGLFVWVSAVNPAAQSTV